MITIEENILYDYNRKDHIIGITIKYNKSNIYHLLFCIMSYIWSIQYHMITILYHLTPVSAIIYHLVATYNHKLIEHII